MIQNKNIFIFLSLTLFIFSCKTSQVQQPKEKYDVINAHFKQKANGKFLYYKTLKNVKALKPIEKRVSIAQLNFLQTPSNWPHRVDYDTIFSPKTMGYLQTRFKNLKSIKLVRNWIYSTRLKKNDRGDDLSFITMPIIIKEGTFAIFYSYSYSFRGKLAIGGSGNLWVYKKDKYGNWIFYSSSTLWMI